MHHQDTHDDDDDDDDDGATLTAKGCTRPDLLIADTPIVYSLPVFLLHSYLPYFFTFFLYSLSNLQSSAFPDCVHRIMFREICSAIDISLSRSDVKRKIGKF